MEIPTVFEKMAMLVLLMLVGYLCAKLHVTGPEFNKRVSPVVMNVLLACTILNSVINVEPARSGVEILEYVGVMTLMMVLGMAVAWFVPRLLRARTEDAGVIRTVVTFSNNAFVGFPVVTAVFGPEAVFYASLSNIPFNMLLYSAGVAQLSTGDGRKFQWREMLSMPLIATFAAVLLFVTRLPVPGILADTIGTFSAATTPMSMLIIGTSLGGIPLREALGDWRAYGIALFRLIVCPVVLWAVLRLFIHDPQMLGIPVILAACPAAMIIAVLCVDHGRDEKLASKSIFLSTVLSAVTLPLLIWLLL